MGASANVSNSGLTDMSNEGFIWNISHISKATNASNEQQHAANLEVYRSVFAFLSNKGREAVQ